MLAVVAAVLVVHALVALSALRPRVHHRRVDDVAVAGLSPSTTWERFGHHAARDLEQASLKGVRHRAVVDIGLFPWDLVADARASGNELASTLSLRVNRHFHEAPTGARCVVVDPGTGEYGAVEHRREGGVTVFRCVRLPATAGAPLVERWRFGVRRDSGIGATVLLALGIGAAAFVSFLLALWVSWARAPEVRDPVTWELSTEGNDTAYRTAEVVEPTPAPKTEGASVETRLKVSIAWGVALHVVLALLRATRWVW